METRTYDALIIGAGPAGSTAARLLAKAGLAVALIEKARFPRRKVCGEFISATSMPLFSDPVLKEEFAAAAGPEIRRVGLFAAGATASAAMPPATRSTAFWGRALGRETLDTLLLESAAHAGARVFQPFKAMRLGREGDRHICTVAGEGETRELRARTVIAANGSWEQSAWTAGHPAPRPSDLLAFKAHFRDSDLALDLMPLVLFPGGYGGMVHTDDARVSLSCCIRRDALDRCRRAHPGLRAGEAVLRHIMSRCEGVRDALKRARLAGAWLSAGPIRPGIRARYADGIFAAGNLAGEAHPIIAEGISMAMQSSWLLSRTLLRCAGDRMSERALAQAGRDYAQAWNTAFAARVRAAALFAHLALWPPGGRVLPLLGRLPQVLTLGARWSGKAKQVVE